ncbi:MAG: FtsQ-type POTRA domain-containing protein [Niameybacter sp.]
MPIWYIQDIILVGNHYYKGSEILKVAAIDKGMHPLSINTRASGIAIETLPFIQNATVRYEFPNTLQVEVNEKRPLGYVTFHDRYLCINGDGTVLEESQEKRLKLPLLEGLQFEYFVIGEKLGIENDEKIRLMNEMIAVLDKYSFTEKVTSIDLSNLEEIHLYVDKLDVIIGNIRDFDKKIKWLVKVHEGYTMGILDLTSIAHGQAVLTPLD